MIDDSGRSEYTMSIDSGLQTIVFPRKGVNEVMMYGLMTLNDETEITHSELRNQDGHDYVRVYVERPVEGGFQSAWCTIPGYQWDHVQGFTPEDIQRFTKLISSMAHLIFRYARGGGFEHASDF